MIIKLQNKGRVATTKNTRRKCIILNLVFCLFRRNIFSTWELDLWNNTENCWNSFRKLKNIKIMVSWYSCFCNICDIVLQISRILCLTNLHSKFVLNIIYISPFAVFKTPFRLHYMAGYWIYWSQVGKCLIRLFFRERARTKMCT